MSLVETGYIEKLMKMEKLPMLKKEPITQVQLVKYAGASGDYNRIHIDKVFADETPLKGVIAHGMLSMAFMGQYLDTLAANELFVKKFKVRFQAMVRVGDEITCQGEVKSFTDEGLMIELVAKNQRGEKVIVGDAILNKDGRER